jgi:hypothetical protein
MEVGLNVAKREILTDCGKRWPTDCPPRLVTKSGRQPNG